MAGTVGDLSWTPPASRCRVEVTGPGSPLCDPADADRLQDEGDHMLEMRTECEGCQRPLPGDSTEATICSFECTWCTSCAADRQGRCPNCTGELVRRPTRVAG